CDSFALHIAGLPRRDAHHLDLAHRTGARGVPHGGGKPGRLERAAGAGGRRRRIHRLSSLRWYRMSTMKLVVGYLATPGGADAVALAARLARTLGAELELCIVLPPERAVPSRLSSGDFDDHLSEQAQKWLSDAAIPADVVARSHISYAESFADGLLKEIARLEADAIVVG